MRRFLNIYTLHNCVKEQNYIRGMYMKKINFKITANFLVVKNMISYLTYDIKNKKIGCYLKLTAIILFLNFTGCAFYFFTFVKRPFIQIKWTMARLRRKGTEEFFATQPWTSIQKKSECSKRRTPKTYPLECCSCC